MRLDRSVRFVYKCTGAGCNSVYVGETCRHISTQIGEHRGADKKSHIFRHLQSSKPCIDDCNDNCFLITDTAKSHYNVKVMGSYACLVGEAQLK